MKNESKVLIGGNVYTLSGDESEEYLQRVALYMNKKMDEVRNSENGKKLNTRLQSVLLAINIADDYFKMKTQTEEQENLETKLNEDLKNIAVKKDELLKQCEEKDKEIEELRNSIKHYKKELDEYIQLFEQNSM